jgi:SAM-dependent methyltransferase
VLASTDSASIELWVDRPELGAVAHPWGVEVAGWLRSDRAGAFAAARIEGGDVSLPVALVTRSDVPSGGGVVVGFQGHIGTPDLVRSDAWDLRYTFNGVDHTHGLDLPAASDDPEARAFANAKAAKLARIAPLLVCPVHRRSLTRKATGLACRRCGHEYRATHTFVDLVPHDSPVAADARPGENVSAMGYDPVAEELISQCRGGLVLDNGAGFRDRYRDDVVNLEIVDYPTTDVLGVGQRLPFRDESFDGVLSIAVLEHVRDPFACAEEIYRVLRPGGQAYVAVPFLQPFHGYPDHFYNMTTSGLRNLFENRFHVHDVGQTPGGVPIFAVSWILEAYSRGLPKATAERFLNLQVRDLIGDDGKVLDRDYVRKLNQEKREELACGNYILVHKRGASA